MKKAILLLLGIFLISFSYAGCYENQIDINSVDKKELIKIYQIGDSRAEQIISLRPFDSLDELTKVVGIGEKTLEQIKNQGLACVLDNREKRYEDERDFYYITENNYNQELIELKREIELLKKELEKNNKEDDIKKIESNQPKIIKLSPKDIKSEENRKIIDKSDYAIYGFIAFSVIILLLVYARRNKIKQELV